MERLWRSVKYEEVYLKEYGGVPEAIGSLGTYLTFYTFYNEERLHQPLGYRTPAAIYYRKRPSPRASTNQAQGSTLNKADASLDKGVHYNPLEIV